LIASSSARGTTIPAYNLCLLGFGNVNRTLAQLLTQREAELRALGIEWTITGIASRRLGWIADPEGLARCVRADGSIDLDSVPKTACSSSNVRDWLTGARADVLFEATSLSLEDGQPAIDHLRAALEHGAHAITANKGPIVHAYRELRDLASRRGRRFLFESTVMDGVPIFSLFRENLPAVQLRAFRGILNSTTNMILGEMEAGIAFDAALKKAQEMGLAETDASHDLEGWDATVKVVALVTVLMDKQIQLEDVERDGISNLSAEQVRTARAEGRPYKLVCSARRTGSGVEARVAPEQVPLSDPLAWVTGTSSIVYFETDIFPGICITENNPGLVTTAYGMLADFVRAVSR
jgi:homoserine dehydrogenase